MKEMPLKETLKINRWNGYIFKVERNYEGDAVKEPSSLPGSHRAKLLPGLRSLEM